MKFEGFSIGDIRVEFPVVLASLAGYSDLPYRQICRELGSQYCTTEAMLDRLLLTEGKLRRRLVHTTPDDHPVAGQIMGNDPDVMARSAGVLCEMGFDAIDLNFACPVRKVLSRRRGGHLMRDPDLAVRIIRAVIAAVDRPVTLKLRRAFAESDRRYADFHQIAALAFDAGVASICVHGRSVEARYKGPSDWDFLAAVKHRFADRTVLGSGDIRTPDDALKMFERTGVDGVTAARGAIGNPWFFRQVRDLLAGRRPYRPSLDEQRRLIRRHFDAAVELYGPRRAPKIMRKFGIKYARMHPAATRVRTAFVAVKRPEHWHAVLDEYYRDPREADSPAGASL